MKIRIHNLRHARPEDESLHHLVATRLEIPEEDISDVIVRKKSVDGRRGRPVRVMMVDVTVKDAEAVLDRHGSDSQVQKAPPPRDDVYRGDQVELGERPLVVGTGPAGLFAAWALAKKGYRPILVDRGKAVKPRWQDVNAYWKKGELNPESNVVFGDGGAGTFSDGKLYTRRNDSRNDVILGLFSELAAAPDILTEGKPHLGTNRLSRALLQIKSVLVDLGVTLQFESHLDDLLIREGKIIGAAVNGETIDCDAIFLATGHSARDVYNLLERKGVAMEARPMAVGVRAEHPQALINEAQLGTPDPETGAADYMLSFQDRRAERSAYTFCMCPGGEVVGASTEPGAVTVNGMSYSHRADEFGNAAIVVTVSPEDYGAEGPLAGLQFQSQLEQAAYREGGGGFVAPAQRIGDFLKGRSSLGSFETSYRRGVRGTDLSTLFPDYVVQTMRRALVHFGRRVRHYDSNNGHLIGVETRTTAPVRILRSDETYQSANIAGLYPIGEGAGFAGGIMSSASDGLRAVERIRARK